MPFQIGNKLGSHGKHARGYKCRNLDQLQNMRWIRKGQEMMRVPAEQLETYLADGWEKGRLAPSPLTRQKQSDAQKARRDKYEKVARTYQGRRERQYKCRYKRTSQDFENILVKQGGHCALCPSTGSIKRKLCWDHDHKCCSGISSCGKCIRGLLCIGCNNLMARFENFVDNGIFLAKQGTWEEKAHRYLNKYHRDTPLTDRSAHAKHKG